MRISVLGLGKMGAPMARNLIKLGHEVTLYNRTSERAAEVAAKGSRVAATVQEAVHEAQVALTMVSGDEAEGALTFGTEGLLAHLPPGAIHLCMSTIGLETSRRLALAHAEAGQGYVAAPVFGRPGTAASGNLWIIVGGPDIQVTRCLTIFDTLGRGITRVGPRAELAHALKLGGNLLASVVTEGLSEVLAYGEKAGMAPGEYLRLLNTAIFKSPMMDTFGGLMVRHQHDPADLTVDSALSDTRLASEASEELDAVMPMAEFLQQRLELAAVQGWGAQDLTVLSRSCRMAAGLERHESEEVPENVPTKGRPTNFMARSAEGEVLLDLNKVTHFEIVKDSVWAWTQGKRYSTPWKHLAEVEKTFVHIAFIRLHRHILLQPDAVLARKADSDKTKKAYGEEIVETAIPGLAEPFLIQPVRVDKKRALPKLADTPTLEGGKDPSWAWAQGQRYCTSWRNLIERTFGSGSSLRLPRHIPLPPEETPALQPISEATPQVRVPEKVERSAPSLEGHLSADPAKDGQRQAAPELSETSHFEMQHGIAWAWIAGRRVHTGWRSLNEIESAFSHVILLRIQRNILLHPEAVISLKPAFGGRAKVQVAGGIELTVSRRTAPRLKELLGM